MLSLDTLRRPADGVEGRGQEGAGEGGGGEAVEVAVKRSMVEVCFFRKSDWREEWKVLRWIGLN